MHSALLVVVDGGGQRQLVMLYILFGLLACALAVLMLAGAAGSVERRRSLLQLCELHAAAASDATPKLLGGPAAAARLRAYSSDQYSAAALPIVNTWSTLIHADPR